MSIPSARGAAIDGATMRAGPRAGVQAIVFLAHWCPHCRTEVATYSASIPMPSRKPRSPSPPAEIRA